MKTAVISGVTRGIGLAIADTLLAQGYRVLGCGSSQQSVEVLAASRPAIKAWACDMADPEAIAAFGKLVMVEAGQVDVLVNNAGRFIPGQIQNEKPGAFEEMINTNVASAYHLSRALLPGMIARRTGTIVNICSTASITPYTNGGSYCISKYAMLGMSKVLREELKPHNIRVVSVLPGATYTDSWAASTLPEDRFMSAQDVAAAVAMACQLPPGTVIEELLMRPMLGDIS